MKKAISVILLLLIFASSAFSPLPAIKSYPIEFYLDPATPGVGNAAIWLPGYVDDMNAILAKNTDVRLVYVGYYLQTTNPVIPVNFFSGTLPQYGFELWAVSTTKGTGVHSGSGGSWAEADTAIIIQRALSLP